MPVLHLVAERVMKRRHVLGGKELELGPYHPDQGETLEVKKFRALNECH